MKRYVIYKAIIKLECEATLEDIYNWNEVEDYFRKNYEDLVDWDKIQIETEAVDDYNETEPNDDLTPYDDMIDNYKEYMEYLESGE